MMMDRDFKLDAFQEEAIRCEREGHSIIVSAPTGAGKTLIAEHVIEDCIKRNKGVIYTAPIKALSNQKFRDFSKRYPGKAGILTGDVSINRDAPILIMTTEIFRNAILVEPQEYEHREWIIFDEVHYLDDIERGTVWEESIILLPEHMRILALSATIPNIDEFVGWLNHIHSFPVKVIEEKNRPVPLHFFFQCNNEFFPNFQKLSESMIYRKKAEYVSSGKRYEDINPNKISVLIKYLKNKDACPCVYFVFSRKKCEILAQKISDENFLTVSEKKKIDEKFNALIKKFNMASSPHINFLTPLIRNGIAYHHAGLLPTLKEIIEQLFTSGLIKMIFTTETFALGINMPVRAVVFDELSKFYGSYYGYLKTRDFYQMAGRAGRRGIDDEGYVFMMVNPAKIDINPLKDIIYGGYEPIKSQLNSCYATIINLHKIMGGRIYDIYNSSFHFQQADGLKKKEALGLLKRKVALLKELKYILDDGISWKADIASKVYSFELAITELFDYGVLDKLDPETLFITITALVYEPRRREMAPRLNKKIKRVKKELDGFMRNINRIERRFRVYPLSKKFYFHLSEGCSLWFRGASFQRLAKSCYVDEGEVVRYFRMSLQVLREMYTSRVISKDFKDKIRYCIKKINRDVIDAEKQLRQAIY